MGSNEKLVSKVLPTFIEALSNSNHSFKECAAIGLSYLKDKAAPAVPLLVNILKENRPGKEDKNTSDDLWANLQFYTIECLGSIGEKASPAIPYIIQFLPYKHFEFYLLRYPYAGRHTSRRYIFLGDVAANALGNIGEKAVPELKKALEDPDLYVKAKAAKALAIIAKKMKVKNYVSCDILLDIIRSKDQLASLSAVATLGEMGGEAIPYLIRAFDCGGHIVGQIAEDAIIQMGEKSVPYLEEALQDPQLYMSHLFIEGLIRRIINPGKFKKQDDEE
jgi:HEAT repeat protein